MNNRPNTNSQFVVMKNSQQNNTMNSPIGLLEGLLRIFSNARHGKPLAHELPYIEMYCNILDMGLGHTKFLEQRTLLLENEVMSFPEKQRLSDEKVRKLQGQLHSVNRERAEIAGKLETLECRMILTSMRDMDNVPVASPQIMKAIDEEEGGGIHSSQQ